MKTELGRRLGQCQNVLRTQNIYAPLMMVSIKSLKKTPRQFIEMNRLIPVLTQLCLH